MIIAREDRRAIAALGGMDAMRQYDVAEWRQRGRDQFLPDSWIVDATAEALLASAGIVPIDRVTAREIAARRSAAGKKGCRTARNNLARENEVLGALPGSGLAHAVRSGEMTTEEAERLAEGARRRHEETEYDRLLAQGIDRDTAREMIRDDRTSIEPIAPKAEMPTK